MATQTKSGRPIMQVPLQPIDYAMEAMGLLSLILMIGLAAYHYPDLPANIPTHFGPDGQPDKTGDKTNFWILPVLGTVLFGFMTLISRFPHQFNYMVNITPENAERQYTMAIRMIRFMKLLVVTVFSYIVWHTIQIAGGETAGLGTGLLILPILILGLTVYYIFKSLSKQ
ncbi:MAG TPA: DUF1648 domain-containing protein [Saprospiraceae bacterium]|nr:DUF1648 domain-containing protein [Saprospiraceae bacterium]